MKSNIRKLRNEKQISQTTLANIIGKTQQSVSHMERDRNCIPVESLLAMADYFGVTTDYILGRDVEEQHTQAHEEATLLNQEADSLLNLVRNGDSKVIYELILSLLLCSLQEQAETESMTTT